VLIFSYVGYATQERIVQPNITLDIVLESSSQSLEGVVIIGYGSVRKKMLQALCLLFLKKILIKEQLQTL